MAVDLVQVVHDIGSPRHNLHPEYLLLILDIGVVGAHAIRAQEFKKAFQPLPDRKFFSLGYLDYPCDNFDPDAVLLQINLSSGLVSASVDSKLTVFRRAS